jgi:GNAT superfamily N-acetyltransferase
MALSLKQIESTSELKAFILFPWQIYKNDPYWVPPLINDTKKFLDRQKGSFFEFGEARYWMVYDGDRPLGRISAHVNHLYEKYHDSQTGFFGFFECVNDPNVAHRLLDAATEWLRQKGKTRVLGPMSFSIYDISGMLYEGFDSIPVVLLAYNPSYYNDLLTQTGFSKAIDWYAFMVDKNAPLRPALLKVRDRVLRQEGLEIIPLDMKDFSERVQQVGHIFSDAWMENWGHVPFSNTQLHELATELKLVAVPELTYFAFYKGECIGFSLSIKDMNPALQKANGRLFPLGLFKILIAGRKIHRLRTIAMGVLKEHRHRGIDMAFYINTIEQGVKMGYTESECSIIVETNDRMISALEDLKARRYKTYRFYEKKI